MCSSFVACVIKRKQQQITEVGIVTLSNVYMEAMNLASAFSVTFINYRFCRNRSWAGHNTHAKSITTFRKVRRVN
jgi:hypothetical protein